MIDLDLDDLVEFDVAGSRDGHPLDIGHGRVLHVRRAGGHNGAYKFACWGVQEEHADELEAAAKDSKAKHGEVLYRCEQIVAARQLVASWNLTKADGSLAPCTEEAVLHLFEQVPGVFEQVQTMSGNDEEYRRLARDTKSDAGGDDVGDCKRGGDVDVGRGSAKRRTRSQSREPAAAAAAP